MYVASAMCFVWDTILDFPIVVAWVTYVSNLHELGIDGIFEHEPHSRLP